MKEAVKLAQQNGYILPEPCELEGIKVYHKGDTVLDPLFWQALGRALNWSEKIVVRRGIIIGNFVGGDNVHRKEMGFDMDYIDPTIYHALQYFELRLTGGNEEQFWNNLLKGK